MIQVFVEEKMIDGILHHRSHTEGRDGTPWTEWEPYTIQALSTAFVSMRARHDKLNEIISGYQDKLEKINKVILE